MQRLEYHIHYGECLTPCPKFDDVKIASFHCLNECRLFERKTADFVCCASDGKRSDKHVKDIEMAEDIEWRIAKLEARKEETIDESELRLIRQKIYLYRKELDDICRQKQWYKKRNDLNFKQEYNLSDED